MDRSERPELLYHYCSTATFASILQSRTLRLSSLLLTNDSSEGTLHEEVIARMTAAQGLLSNEVEALKKRFRDVVAGDVNRHYLAFCMSEAPDLLSQWRGYADYGSGVCFGLRLRDLESLAMLSIHVDDPDRYPVKFMKVLYSQQDQEARVRAAFSNPELILASALESFGQLYNIHSLRYEFKSSGFAEEKEWRLVTYLEPHKCKYRVATPEKVIPYTEIPLNAAQIKHVILGPRHETPIQVFESFLASFGCTAAVRKSAISFRR